MGLLVVAHMLQPWRGQGKRETLVSPTAYHVSGSAPLMQVTENGPLPLVMFEPLLMAANNALRLSAPESPPPPEDPLKSMAGGGGPGGGGGGHPPAGALGGAAEVEATAP